MPGVIGIGDFIEETREDYNSPTTSTFVSRMPQCRQTISSLEEVRDSRISIVIMSGSITNHPRTLFWQLNIVAYDIV